MLKDSTLDFMSPKLSRPSKIPRSKEYTSNRIRDPIIFSGVFLSYAGFEISGLNGDLTFKV